MEIVKTHIIERSDRFYQGLVKIYELSDGSYCMEVPGGEGRLRKLTSEDSVMLGQLTGYGW